MDEDSLEVYCELRARWWRSREDVKENGDVLVDRDSGKVSVNPSVVRMEKAEREMRLWLSEFGFSPSGRSGLEGISFDEDDFPFR